MSPSASRVRVVTVAILVVGWGISVPLYAWLPPPEADPLYDYKHSKSYVNGVEHFGGKATVFANELTERVATLFRGSNLGLTLMVLTALVAAGYFVRAMRLRKEDG